MRPFLTFLSLFTLFFFLSPVLCLSIPATATEQPSPTLPQTAPVQGVDQGCADVILGMVAALDLRGYHTETLKAAAVICTTQFLKTYAETGTGDGLSYLTPDEAKAAWGDYWFSQYWDQMQQAVREVWGMVLTEGEGLFSPSAFALSWGQTEEGIPCPLDHTGNDFSTQITVPLEEFTAVFPRYSASLKVKNAPSGRVESVTSGDTVLSGYEMMERFSLPSPAFTLTVTASGAKFSCKGKGAGKGMSLYGANELAKQGKTFRELLATFYPTATLQEANRSLGSK
ncbi:MAG: hypothetical protein II348_01095 [Clostridia bacterium]|nr:hypothetical protein [Clostridia bacterium]